MGYRSDIRIVTSKEGYEKLKEFVTNYLKEHNEDYNLLEECDIRHEGKNQVYFGWNYLKWYEGSYKEVDAIMEGLNYLGENEYSYRYSRIGESYDDYEEQYYDGNKEKENYLEYPNLIREFEDEYVLNLIRDKQEMKLDNKEEQKEEIDI